MLEASQTALDLGADPAEFACQLSSLHELGVRDTTLGWLLIQGLAEHSLETTRETLSHRSFRPTANLRFTLASCFTLTPVGLALAQSLFVADLARLDLPHPVGPSHLPHYDADRRMLLVDGLVVKHFRVWAKNQELILLAFEEEKWPPHIDDPLPGKAGVEAKWRLNNAIRNLNARQRQPLLRFQGDGTGMGILWKRLT